MKPKPLLATLLLSLTLTVPAWALPLAGDYTIQLTSGQAPNQDGSTTHTVGPLGSFTSDGTALTQWNFGFAAYGGTQGHWDTADSFILPPSFPLPGTEQLVFHHPGPDFDAHDDHALALTFASTNPNVAPNSFNAATICDFCAGFFTYHPVAANSVPLPGMLWPTVAGLLALAWIMARRRTHAA